MTLKLIDAAEVERRLTMPICIDLIARVQAAISAGRVINPLRAIHPVAGGAGFFGLMPGELADEAIVGAKLVTLYPGNPADYDLPAIQGYILLFDRNTGTPTALIDAATVTAIRTAAASGAATRVLANEDATSLALLGYGVQAKTHLEAIRAVRNVREVRVWGPSMDKASVFAEREAHPDLEFVPVSTPDEAVAGANIVCAVSNAHEPIVLGSQLQPGCHVNLVGAHSPTTREADAAVFQRSRVFTEITEAALVEAGDILIPVEAGEYSADQIAGEIGAVINGDVEGRQSADQITVYKSLGNTAQDLAAASYLVG